MLSLVCHSHYFTDRVASLGCVNELEILLHDSLSIYKSNEVEVSSFAGMGEDFIKKKKKR